MKTDILRLERNVLNFLRSYFSKKNSLRYVKNQYISVSRVRKPTVKEMAKHPKLLRKQRARLGGV